MLAKHKTKTHGLYFVFLFFIQSTSRAAEQSVMAKTPEAQEEDPVENIKIAEPEVGVFVFFYFLIFCRVRVQS